MKLSVIYRANETPRFSICIDEGNPAILERRMSMDNPLEVMKVAAAFVADTDRTAARPSMDALLAGNMAVALGATERALHSNQPPSGEEGRWKEQRSLNI